MLCIDSTSSIMQSNYDKSGMHHQAANYNTNLLSVVSLSLRGITGSIQYCLSCAYSSKMSTA